MSIKKHLGKEYRLYNIENNENNDSHKQQHVFVMPAFTLRRNIKHIQKTVDEDAVVVSQTDKKANIANITPFSECLEVSQCLSQINIEEHQNKENENPAAYMKPGMNYCNFYTLAVRNEQEKVENLDSRVEVHNHVYSPLLRNAVNDSKGASYPQRIRVRMGTKTFSDAHKEDSEPYQKAYDTASIPISDIFKQSSLQDVYVLSK